nr:peptide-methionine (R)-S-oxide reductase [Angustibacter aerolatus]
MSIFSKGPAMKPTTTQYLVVKDDAEWREQASAEEFHVLREAGTERPFVGEYTDTTTEGVYACRACGTEPVHQRHQVRVALRVAVVLRPRGGQGRVHRGPLVRQRAHRGALRHLRLAPRARLLRRGLPDADRPALLHQQRLDDAAAEGLTAQGRRSTRPGRSARGPV